jgi:hypothetical protein
MTEIEPGARVFFNGSWRSSEAGNDFALPGVGIAMRTWIEYGVHLDGHEADDVSIYPSKASAVAAVGRVNAKYPQNGASLKKRRVFARGWRRA